MSRELDAQIAEKIFGWVHIDKFTISGAWQLPGGFQRIDCPHYSTNIADAWEVVEKMVELGHKVEIESCYNNTWRCGFTKDFVTNQCPYALTLPEAICKAALFCELERRGTNQADMIAKESIANIRAELDAMTTTQLEQRVHDLMCWPHCKRPY